MWKHNPPQMSTYVFTKTKQEFYLFTPLNRKWTLNWAQFCQTGSGLTATKHIESRNYLSRTCLPTRRRLKDPQKSNTLYHHLRNKINSRKKNIYVYIYIDICTRVRSLVLRSTMQSGKRDVKIRKIKVLSSKLNLKKTKQWTFQQNQGSMYVLQQWIILPPKHN